MNPWIAFCMGVNLGVMVCCVAAVLGNRRATMRLKTQRALLDAMKVAEKASAEAARRGDQGAFELLDAEFWALSAELDLALGIQRKER